MDPKEKDSYLHALLSEIVFRHNQESNTRYTFDNAPVEVLRARAKLPTFPLNALNYPIFLTALHLESNLELLCQLAKPGINSLFDNLSFWLVEVPIYEFLPIYQELVALGINLDKLDPKLQRIFNRYNQFTAMGIRTNNDLIEAMQKLQNTSTIN